MLASSVIDSADPAVEPRPSCFCGVHWCDSPSLFEAHALGLTRLAALVYPALGLAAALNPVLYRLWVHLYTGNANFVLATTIVHSLALTAGVVNIVGGACA